MTSIEDRQFILAQAVNSAVNDAIDKGINESRAFAAHVAAHAEVKAAIERIQEAVIKIAHVEGESDPAILWPWAQQIAADACT